MKTKHILVLGSGSVGKRHARNFAALGCEISCFDPREDRRSELASEVKIRKAYDNWYEALEDGASDGVVVASPTAYHAVQAEEAMRRGIPVLLEKPLAKTAVEAREMAAVHEATSTPLLLGYTWRWWPPLKKARVAITAGELGTIRHVQFYMSAHLADWHPWEPYQEFFMSSASEGGGALLDESHWIDLMYWFFGKPEAVYAQVERISDLEIDSDDNVDILVEYGSGLRASVHLDLYGRPHEKSIRFVGSKGTLVWSAEPNELRIGRGSGQEWEYERFDYERNEMFTQVAQEFITVLDGHPPKGCTVSDGVAVMEFIESVRRSSVEGRKITLEDHGV